MKKIIPLVFTALMIAPHLQAQIEPNAGKWKTWFISSGKEYRLPPPPHVAATNKEVETIRGLQKQIDSAAMQKILYWNAGAPSYRWREIIREIALADTNSLVSLVFVQLNVGVYDAIIAAWDTKYAYNRPRPFETDKRIKSLIVKPTSPSYPCEYAVAAGVASAIVAHYFPTKVGAIEQMVREALQARVQAGVQYPSDTDAGFELGKRVAQVAIAQTKDNIPKQKWDGKIPSQPGMWNGKYPQDIMLGKWKPIVLTSASQLRPGPPPDYKQEMEELKKFKPSLRSMVNVYSYLNAQIFWRDVLDKKIFEYNLHLNPPRAERIYAVRSIANYDTFIACWDAKYAYWGIRPNQYDTTYTPSLTTPGHPGYPSGHAAIAGSQAAFLSYFFPADKSYFWQKAKEIAESRFEGGIHFRTDNVVGLDLGKKVGELVLKRAKVDETDQKVLK
jgi:hypothetical protein